MPQKTNSKLSLTIGEQWLALVGIDDEILENARESVPEIVQFPIQLVTRAEQTR